MFNKKVRDLIWNIIFAIIGAIILLWEETLVGGLVFVTFFFFFGLASLIQQIINIFCD